MLLCQGCGAVSLEDDGSCGEDVDGVGGGPAVFGTDVGGCCDCCCCC